MIEHTALVVVALASLAFAISLAAPESATSGYSFSLNGKPIAPSQRSLRSLHIDKDGVLVYLDDLVLLVDEEGPHEFKGDLDKNGRLYELVDGKEHLIGLKTGPSYAEDSVRTLRPFSGLTVRMGRVCVPAPKR